MTFDIMNLTFKKIKSIHKITTNLIVKKVKCVVNTGLTILFSIPQKDGSLGLVLVQFLKTKHVE